MAWDFEVVSENLYRSLVKRDTGTEKNKRLGVNIISNSNKITFIEVDNSEMVELCNVFTYTFESAVKLKLFQGSSADEKDIYRVAMDSMKSCKEKAILTIKKKDILKVMHYANLIADEMLDSNEVWYRPFNVQYRENCIKFYNIFYKYAI